MSDAKLLDCIHYLNLVRAKLLARKAMLEFNQDRKERIRDDLDRTTRALEHVRAATLFLDSTHHMDDEYQPELPF